ncbi:unnamed protein product, partial [Ectocarpus sp. 12 AP-2014]
LQGIIPRSLTKFIFFYFWFWAFFITAFYLRSCQDVNGCFCISGGSHSRGGTVGWPSSSRAVTADEEVPSVSGRVDCFPVSVDWYAFLRVPFIPGEGFDCYAVCWSNCSRGEFR